MASIKEYATWGGYKKGLKDEGPEEYPKISYIADERKLVYDSVGKLEANTNYLKEAMSSLYDAGIIASPEVITVDEYESNYMCYGKEYIWMSKEEDGVGGSIYENNRNIDSFMDHYLSSKPDAEYSSQEDSKFYFYDGAQSKWIINDFFRSGEDGYYSEFLMLYGKGLKETKSFTKLKNYLASISTAEANDTAANEISPETVNDPANNA